MMSSLFTPSASYFRTSSSGLRRYLCMSSSYFVGFGTIIILEISISSPHCLQEPHCEQCSTNASSKASQLTYGSFIPIPLGGVICDTQKGHLASHALLPASML